MHSHAVAATTYRTTYGTDSGCSISEPHSTLEFAARRFDALQFQFGAPMPGDGIERQAWCDCGAMIADGWIIRMGRAGDVYINPGITETR